MTTSCFLSSPCSFKTHHLNAGSRPQDSQHPHKSISSQSSGQKAGVAGTMQTLSSGRVVRGTAIGRQTTLRCKAMAENPSLLKKPELKRPDAPPKKLFDDVSEQPTSAAEPASSSHSVAQPAQPSTAGDVTIEYQRQRAKEIRQYFQQKQLEAQVQKGTLFGWTPANEIGNGRWVMFGVFVGLLTEYATGVNFPDQIALLLNYLGIVDLD